MLEDIGYGERIYVYGFYIECENGYFVIYENTGDDMKEIYETKQAKRVINFILK